MVRKFFPFPPLKNLTGGLKKFRYTTAYNWEKDKRLTVHIKIFFQHMQRVQLCCTGNGVSCVPNTSSIDHTSYSLASPEGLFRLFPSFRKEV
jgi:hypothetical protein